MELVNTLLCDLLNNELVAAEESRLDESLDDNLLVDCKCGIVVLLLNDVIGVCITIFLLENNGDSLLLYVLYDKLDSITLLADELNILFDIVELSIGVPTNALIDPKKIFSTCLF